MGVIIYRCVEFASPVLLAVDSTGSQSINQYADLPQKSIIDIPDLPTYGSVSQ
jgi:hypothetical protein